MKYSKRSYLKSWRKNGANEIIWIHIKNVKEYVEGVMRYEADDVPKKFLEQGTWEQAEIALEDIQIESALIEEQEREALHIERRDRFVDAIQKGRPILPLIILRRRIKSV